GRSAPGRVREEGPAGARGDRGAAQSREEPSPIDHEGLLPVSESPKVAAAARCVNAGEIGGGASPQAAAVQCVIDHTEKVGTLPRTIGSSRSDDLDGAAAPGPAEAAKKRRATPEAPPASEPGGRQEERRVRQAKSE